MYTCLFEHVNYESLSLAVCVCAQACLCVSCWFCSTVSCFFFKKEKNAIYILASLVSMLMRMMLVQR
jgi:hypothetical protein